MEQCWACSCSCCCCCCCCCCCFLGFLLMFTACHFFQGVGDGICDCCDGSDEWQRPNSCRNVCAEQGRERKAIQDLLHFTFQFVPFEHCYWLFWSVLPLLFMSWLRMQTHLCVKYHAMCRMFPQKEKYPNHFAKLKLNIPACAGCGHFRAPPGTPRTEASWNAARDWDEKGCVVFYGGWGANTSTVACSIGVAVTSQRPSGRCAAYGEVKVTHVAQDARCR